MEEFSVVDETDAQAAQCDPARSAASLEKWGWIMFECGIENLTVKGKLPATRRVGAEHRADAAARLLSQGAASPEPSSTTPSE